MSATVNLTGVRVESSEIYQNKNYTIVSVPAPDAYSHPSKFRVTSDRALGVIGSVLDLDCSIRGMVRPKKYVDKTTGQQKEYIETDVYFDVFAVRPHVAGDAPASVGNLPAGVKSSRAE